MVSRSRPCASGLRSPGQSSMYFTGALPDLKEITAWKVLLRTTKGSTKIGRCFYSSYLTDEDIEAKRHYTWSQKPRAHIPALLAGGLGWVTPKPQLVAQVSPSQASLRVPSMVYENECTGPAPQEAFNKCSPAKQKLHGAPQNTGGKMRLKLYISHS